MIKFKSGKVDSVAVGLYRKYRREGREACVAETVSNQECLTYIVAKVSSAGVVVVMLRGAQYVS